MNNFNIESNPANAQVYLLDGFNRNLIGATPLTLEKDKFASQQIIVIYNEKEKAFSLDSAHESYFVDFTTLHNTFNKYGVYLNGSLQYLNINQFENEIKAGTKIESVYIDGKHKLVSEVPELLAITNLYHQTQKEYSSQNNHDQTVISPSNADSDNIPIYILIGLLLVGGLIWFIVANTKKTDTVVTDSYTDSSAVATVDSAAAVVDIVASDVIPQKEIVEIKSDKSALAELGVSTFNDNSYVKPNYDGCGSYFSLDRLDNDKGNYIFTGMISSFFGNNTDDAFVEMVIDGRVEHFSYYESGNNGNYIFLRGTNMTLEINLEEVGSGEEAIIYSGTAELNKNGNIKKFKIYGVSGC